MWSMQYTSERKYQPEAMPNPPSPLPPSPNETKYLGLVNTAFWLAVLCV